MENNKSNIWVEVCPSSSHLDAPVTWLVYRGGIFLGCVRKATDGSVALELVNQTRLINTFTIDDLSRILNFLKGFPDPVVASSPEENSLKIA